MKEKDFYLEFTISGVIKLSQSQKLEVSEKLSSLISDLLEDEELNLIRADSSMDMFSEDELAVSLLAGSEEPLDDDFN